MTNLKRIYLLSEAEIADLYARPDFNSDERKLYFAMTPEELLDVTYREDESRVRRENAAKNIAVARRFALNLARLHPKKDSMRGKLKQAMWSDDFRHQIIFGHEVSKV